MGMPESLWRQKRIPNSQVGSLRLVRCGTEYEQDSGVLWAEPGVLHFEGVRTTIILPNGSPHIDSATFEGKGLFRIFLKDPKLPQIKIGCRTPTDGNEKFTAKDMFDVWRSQVGPEELTKLSPKDYPPELLDKKRTATAVAGFCFLAIYMIGLAAMQLRSEPTAFSYVIFALMCVVYAMLPWFWVTRYLKIRSIRHELGLE